MRARSVAGRYLITINDTDPPTYKGPMASNAQSCQSDAQRLFGPKAVASPWRKAPVAIQKLAKANNGSS